ncbi:sigma-E factor negative regulatory protein [Undibacterium sp.]|uniref:sigma-E factor negative regulatory protein n=1 Tax=Undibacterium sp. TaxID=1914977 RepID=UPI0037539E0B
MNKRNHDELISSVIDGEATKLQLDKLLNGLKGEDGSQVKATWERYHELGDVLRSDDLAVTFSADFSDKFSALLAAEPNVLAPKVSVIQSTLKSDNGTKKSAYWAITSVAATVMLGFLMAPQILPLLNPVGASEMLLARVDKSDPFAVSGVKLASNANSSASASANVNANKEQEFAPKLENQVEMLRDPRLDSYLLAHQKVSPSFDNGARNIQRANVVSLPDTEK